MRYFENLEKTSENRLKQRSFYIPSGDAVYTLLNGEWRFFYEKDGDSIAPDSKINKWKKVTVPSCWQTTGYDYANYTNINYPFPLDPPYVPEIDPVGIYEREFNIKDASKRIYMVFEAISSCGALYINGSYVGFTQGSHLQAEFDITDFVKTGKNTVRVVVRKWCCGSYLEDQDFFRMNGIFRDVYVLERPIGHIVDIDIHTENNDTVFIKTAANTSVSLYYGTKLLSEALTDKDGKASFYVENAALWNAEQPNLYRLEFSAVGEKISQEFGFRTISVSDKKEILINGTPIKLKGVNHHDSTLHGGWVMSDEEIIKDLTLMKELNINCIRTSHYPPSPRFLDYCDKMGFYVCLETDIETHGFLQRYGGCIYSFDVENGFWPCAEKVYEKEMLERMERAYHRDKNHSSIFMWSVGNESGYAENTKKMVAFLHKEDPRRLVHAEDASRAWARWDSKIEDAKKAVMIAKAKGEDKTEPEAYLNKILENLDKAKEDHKVIDVYSRMYPNTQKCEKWAKADSDIDYPIFHCEIAHFRLDGPSSVWDYTELMYKYPKFVGFALWEWCDHAVLKDGVQCYGGDFEGEEVNNASYCCDGVVFCDRSLKPGSLEVKAAFAPFRFKYENGIITLENRHDFLNLSEFCVQYRLVCDGEILKTENLTVECAPRESVQINTGTLFPNICSYGCYADVSLFTKNGKEIGYLQQIIQADRQRIINDDASCADIYEEGNVFIAKGEGFTYKFSKRTGNLESMMLSGKELLAEPVKISALRAYMDCEGSAKDRWIREATGVNMAAAENLDFEHIRIYNAKCQGGKITFEGSIAGVARTPYFRYTLSVRVFSNGSMFFELDGDIKSPCCYLARLGFDFVLKKKNCRFEYFGMGPVQNYIDCNKAAALGWYESNAENEYVNFVVPQEHGNHTKARELTVDNRLCFKAEKEFDFNVSAFSAKQILNAFHTNEIGESKATHIRIDYKNSGYMATRTANPSEAIALSEKKIHFSFALEI